MRTFRIIKLLWCVGIGGMFLFSSSTAQAFFQEEPIAIARGLAHYIMGYRYDLLGQTNRAVLEYEKASQFDSGEYVVHLRMGTDYARLNMLSEAERELKLAYQLNPDDMQSHYLLALIYSNDRQYEKAADEYEIILKTFSQSDPKNIEIYNYLGQLYYSQRKYDQAIAQFEKILILEPNNADVMYMLGSLYAETSQTQKAIEILKKSISIDAEHDGSLNTLGYVYAQEGKNLDEALELVQKAVTIAPDNGAYLDSLGWVFYKKEMYGKALEVLLKADALLKDPVIYNHMGDVYQKLNRMQEAVKYWKLSLESLPGQDSVRQKIESVEKAQVYK